MWSNLRTATVNLLRCPEWATQTKRTTFILKRVRPVRLNPLGATFPKRLKKREYYYELVEDTNCTKKPPLELVLMQDVAGLGMRGEKIKVNPYKAYKDLLLPKLAAYATSPEAKDIMKSAQEKQYSSIYSRIVENYLAGKALTVILSYETPWTLQPWHVKIALRQAGIFANDDCISIPKEISGPNPEIENRDFLIYLIMNKSEKFPVRCRIYHWSTTEVSLNQKSFDTSSPSDVLFADEEETIQMLRKVEKEIKDSGALKTSLGKDQKSRRRKHSKGK